MITLQQPWNNYESACGLFSAQQGIIKPSRAKTRAAHVPFPQCSGDMSSMLRDRQTEEGENMESEKEQREAY